MVGAGCRRKASCNPARLAKSGGRVSKAAKPGAEQPEPRTARRASMARIASTHPLTRRWGQRPQLNKPTSGRQARPPKGGSGALLGQSFYVHKNISGYSASRGQIAHVAWQRISAPFVKTVEPFALVVSLKMRDLHSLVSQVELLLSPIGVAVFLHKPNAVAVENSAGFIQ